MSSLQAVALAAIQRRLRRIIPGCFLTRDGAVTARGIAHLPPFTHRGHTRITRHRDPWVQRTIDTLDTMAVFVTVNNPAKAGRVRKYGAPARTNKKTGWPVGYFRHIDPTKNLGF